MALAGTAFINVEGNFAAFDRQAAAAAQGFQRKMDSSWGQVGNRLNSAGSKMSAVGGKLTRSVTLPLAALGAAAIKASSDFQASMEMVHTQAGASQAEVDRLKSKVLDLAKAMPQGPNQLAQGLFHLESIGLRGAKAMDALKIAAQGAAVGHADLEQTATALGSAWLVNIKGAGDLHHVMGLLNATVGAGNMRMEDLVQALGTGVLPASKEAGLSIRDVMGALAVFTDEGYNASSAAAQFSTSLHFLYNPTSKASTALKDIGLKSSQLAIDMHKPQGLLVALRDLKTHLEEGGRSAVAQEQILGQILPGGRGRILLTLINQLDRYQMKLGQIDKTSSQFGEDVAKTQQTASYKIRSAWSNIQVAAVKVGDSIGPPLIKIGEDVANWVGKVATDFAKLPAGAQSTILKGGLILAGIGPAMKLLGLFTGGVGRLYNVALIATRLMRGQGLAAFNLKGASASGTAGRLTSSVATIEVGTLVARTLIAGGEVGAAGGAGRVGSTAAVVRSEEKAASATVGGLLRGGLARVLRGGTTAIVGTLGAQLLGSVVGGGAGKTISHVGSYAGIGAGIGSAIEPGIGTAVGAALGAGFSFFIGHHAQSEGEKIGSKVSAGMKKTAVGSLPGFAKAVAAADDKANRVPGIRRDAAGQPVTEPGFHGYNSKNGVPQLVTPTQAELDVRGPALFKGGQTLGAKWASYFQIGAKDGFKHLDLGMLQLNAKAALANMKPAMRAGASQSMEAFVRQMEHDGRLPKGSLKEFIRSMNSQFPSLVKGFDYGAAASVRALNARLKFTDAQHKTGDFIKNLKSQWQALPKSADLNTKNAADVFKTNLDGLHRIAEHSTGQTKKDALANFKQLRDQAQGYFSDMRSGIDAQMKGEVKSLGKNTQAGKQAVATGYKQIVGVIQTEMSSGVISTQRGMQMIASALSTAFKAFGISGKDIKSFGLNLPGAQKLLSDPAAVQSNINRAKDHALGGVVVGQLGERGRDNVLMDVPPGSAVINGHQLAELGFARGGGVPIAVGRGEVVVPPDQVPGWDRLARNRRFGGLRGLFSKVNRKHYLADGGMAQRFAAGGLAQMIAEANSIDAHHYGYSWGGGHGQIGVGPYDCSGAVSAVLHAGGLLGQPMVAQQFESFGLPGPGEVTIYASNGHVYMSLGGRFFGTSNSNPGGGAGWFPGAPRPGFTVRHVPATGGSIKTPKVTGPPGAITGLVQRVLGLGAKGANQKLSDAIAAMGQTGGGDAGDLGIAGNMMQIAQQAASAAGLQWGSAEARTIGNLLAAESSGGHNLPATSPGGPTGPFQVKGATFAQYKAPGHDNINNPVDNALAAMRYIKARYHSIAGLEAATHPHPGYPGYARGGIVGAFARGGVTDKAKAFLGTLWSGASSFYPRHAMPTTKIGEGDGLGGAFNYTVHGHNRYSSLPAWMFEGGNWQPAAAETALHEWAHYFQNGPVWHGPQWVYEGGAQEFARMVMPQVAARLGERWGVTPRGDDSYLGFAHKFLGAFGPDYALHGQFAKAKSLPRHARGGIVGRLLAATGLSPHLTAAHAKRKKLKHHHKPLTLRQKLRKPFKIAELTGFDPTALMAPVDSDLKRFDNQESLLERLGQITLPDGTTKQLIDTGDIPLLASTFPPQAHPGESIVDAETLNRTLALSGMNKKVGVLRGALATIGTAVAERQKRRGLVEDFLKTQFKRYQHLQKDLADLTSSDHKRQLRTALDGGRRQTRINGAKDAIAGYQGLIADEQSKGKHADHNKIRQYHAAIRQEDAFVRAEHANAPNAKGASARIAVIRDGIRAQLTPVEQDLHDFGGNKTQIGKGGFLGQINGDLKTLADDQGQLGDAVSQLVQSDIPNLQLDIRALGATPAKTPGADSSATADLLRTALDQAHLALSVSQAQYKVLDRVPFGGVFHDGGVVPGPVGAERMILAQGGEVVKPRGTDGGSVADVHLYFAPGTEWLRDFVRVEMRSADRSASRHVGHGLPGRGGGLSR